MKRYRLPLLIALAALVVFVGLRVREATDGTYRTQQQLRQVPETHLFYPGPVVLSHGGGNQKSALLGQREAAFSKYTRGTNVPEEEPFAFYRERLSSAGGQSSGAADSLSSGQLRAIVYRRGSLVIQVTTLQRNSIRNPQAIDAYQTSYQLYIVADRPR